MQKINYEKQPKEGESHNIIFILKKETIMLLKKYSFYSKGAKRIKGLFFALFLVSCQDGGDYRLQLASRSNSFSPAERLALFPNELFVALADQKRESALREILNKKGRYLFTVNKRGDSPLGLAIKWDNLKGALFIARQLSPEHYLFTNKKGEGYLYLASQKGYVELIQLLAEGFYKSRRDIFLDYEFSDLDMKTKEGERALHVAKNHAVAEALKQEYWRGDLEFPLKKFQYLKNNKGQTFLHTAVRDQNRDLILWAVAQNCASKGEWESRPFYEKYFSYFWRGLQSYGKFVDLDWDDVINTQDNKGRTALNFSAQTLFFEGIYALSSCQWTDYLLKDNEGNIPLQNFLLALDPAKPHYSEELKEAFSVLRESQTRLSLSEISGHINSVNKKGESSLHISARLSDPFFYNSLKKYGDIDQRNKEGQSPRELFSSKREKIQQARSL